MSAARKTDDPGDHRQGVVATIATADARADRVQRSLSHSIRDGVFWAVMHGAGERYVLPLIILGNSEPLRVGLLFAIPIVAGGIVQCFSAEVTDRVGQRLRLVLGGASLQALTWIPICATAFLQPGAAYWLMLFSYIAYLGLHNFAVPPWISIMGDLVPAERRGRYFGLRNFLVGAAVIASYMLAGAWLDWTRLDSRFSLLGLPGQRFGFLVLFALAGFARCASVWQLAHMHEPEYHRAPTDRFSLWEFIVRAPRAQFGRFVFYCALLNAGINFVAPFFNWYLLHVRHFDTLTFAWIGTANLIVYFGTQPFWGRMVDRVGSKRVLTLGGWAIVAVPVLLYAVNSVFGYTFVMIFEGAAMAAFAMSYSSYLYDIVTPPKRARCIAYHTLFMSVGSLIGAVLAGVVVQFVSFPLYVGPLRIEHAFAGLLAGGLILRALPNVLLLWTFREFRLKSAAPAA